MRALIGVLGLVPSLLVGSAAIAADFPEDNKELNALYDADQAERKFFETTPPSEWRPEVMLAMSQHDVLRRGLVRKLLAGESLATANDYLHAAMVMQHGDAPEEFLLAHQLATVAGFKGSVTGKWLAAASLDRYLMKIKQSQVFGTQYNNSGHVGSNAAWTMEPYDRTMPDALRREFGVPTLAESEKRLEGLRSNKPLGQ